MYLFFVLIIKESSFSILSRWSTWNLSDIFKDFPGLINKIQGLSRTVKKSGLFQDVATLFPISVFASLGLQALRVVKTGFFILKYTNIRSD